MRVARLEIFGFKSFLEKLVLPLETGLTGIVGPNGCGKSNIVDAIRWILGETRASQLRGGALEDVIFNGTDKLRPLGLAEVTLTLRSAESDFFSEIVSVLTRQGNQFAATLAEVAGDEKASEEETSEEDSPLEEEGGENEVRETENQSFDSSVQGRPHLTVISGALAQDSTSATTPPTQEVEKHVLEVLDGGVTLESIDVKAEGIPEAQETNASDVADEDYARHALNRFGWLRNVQEVQVTRRLYRSGESEFFINRVPCRLKDIKELFRLAGLGARAYTIVAQGEVGRVVTSRPEERRLIIEEAAGVAGFREKIAAAGRRLEETNVNLTRLDDVTREVQRQVNSLRVQAGRAKARQQLKDRVLELERKVLADQYSEVLRVRKERDQSLSEARAAETMAEASFEQARVIEQEARGSVLTIDVAGDDVRRRIDAISDELRDRGERRAKCLARLSEANAQVEASGTQLRSLQDRRETLVERKSETERAISDLESKDASLVQQIGGGSVAADELARELAQQLATLREELQSKERECRATRDALVSHESRGTALEEQIEAASPVAQMRDLITEKNNSAIFGSNRVDSSSNVESDSRFQAVIDQLSAEAKLFVAGIRAAPEHFKALQIALGEKISFLIAPQIEAIAAQYSQVALQWLKGGEQTLKAPALGLIRTGVAEAQVPHAEEAKIPVTFPRLLDLLEVAPECREAAQQLFRMVFLAPSAEEAFAFFSRHDAALVQDITLVTLHGERITAHAYYCAGDNDHSVLHLQREAELLKEKIVSLRASYEAAEQDRQALANKILEAERAQGEAIAESRRQQAHARELSNQQGAIRGRLHAERRVLAQLEQDLSRIDQSATQLTSQIEQYQRMVQERHAELAQLDRSMSEAGNVEDLQRELGELRAEWKDIEAKRAANRDALGALAQKLELTRNDRERARALVSKAELEVEKTALELQSVQQRVESEFGAEFFAQLMSMVHAEHGAVLSVEERSQYQDELQKIRARITREGEVDSSSIERFEEEQKRLSEIVAQREDLSIAAKTLERTIEKLRETSEARFLSTFKAVRSNFARLIPRLFGGGRGSLELTDPNKPLESGIEISVRPPGKKLKSIELMSGGEKALCAIALIVGMFIERPSPLCILDEVDAPLDDANLVRFLSLLKDMSHQTQFVMVTHNKQTMTVADRLIGVTMQQPGASTVVTVSLQEAYQHVA